MPRDHKAERKRRKKGTAENGADHSRNIPSATSTMAFLAVLRAERVKLDAAIAAVEALA